MTHFCSNMYSPGKYIEVLRFSTNSEIKHLGCNSNIVTGSRIGSCVVTNPKRESYTSSMVYIDSDTVTHKQHCFMFCREMLAALTFSGMLLFVYNSFCFLQSPTALRLWFFGKLESTGRFATLNLPSKRCKMLAIACIFCY